MQLAKRISPSMDIGPLSAPYLLVPMLALAQVVNVAAPGQEPDPAQPFSEDMRLFDSALTEPDGAAQPLLVPVACSSSQFLCRAKVTLHDFRRALAGGQAQEALLEQAEPGGAQLQHGACLDLQHVPALCRHEQV